MLTFTSWPPGVPSEALLAIAVCKNQNLYQDPVITGLVQQAAAFAEFSGDKDEQLVLYQPEYADARRAVLLGLGDKAALEAEDWRTFAGKAVALARARKLSTLTIAAPAPDSLHPAPPEWLSALLEGAALANHTFDHYKTPKEKPLESIAIWVDAETAARFADLPKRVQTICSGTLLVRDWVDTSSNHKTPAQLADSIGQAAREAGLTVTIWDEKELARQQCGALLAVAAGSPNLPRMVLLEHAMRSGSKPMALVGKGVTFDTGGINLKPSDGIKNMKMDMAGAAVVAATMITAARLRLDQHLVGVIPIVENMPSGQATRPGDVITSRNGKTVEINNTDAEGRLILADALDYVIQAFNPRAIIDLATLTGACVMALGEKIAGLFSTDDNLTQQLLAAGRQTHERCWPMPLPADYQELLKSEIADLSNISDTRWGGAITAALFLKEFTGQTPWAHLDIAGPAFNTRATAYVPKGGSGFGVRLLVQYLTNLQAP